MKIKEAVILAGGKGTGLSQVTNNLIPKPLVEIAPNITMLGYAIKGLFQIGITKIYITTFHLSDQIDAYVHKRYKDNFQIEIVKEKKELGTGGSVLELIKSKTQNPLLVLSSDTFFIWPKVKGFLEQSSCKIMTSKAILGVTEDTKNSQAPFNVVYSRPKNVLIFYSNRVNKDTPQKIKDVMKVDDVYKNITGAGLVVINPSVILAEKTHFKYPICLFNDMLPDWAKDSNKVFVEMLDSIVLDMGTPDRLDLARKLLKTQHDKT